MTSVWFLIYWIFRPSYYIFYLVQSPNLSPRIHFHLLLNSRIYFSFLISSELVCSVCCFSGYSLYFKTNTQQILKLRNTYSLVKLTVPFSHRNCCVIQLMFTSIYLYVYQYFFLHFILRFSLPSGIIFLPLPRYLEFSLMRGSSRFFFFEYVFILSLFFWKILWPSMKFSEDVFYHLLASFVVVRKWFYV